MTGMLEKWLNDLKALKMVLIGSFSLRFSKRVSKFLVLCSFALFKRKSVLFVPDLLSFYLHV